jgi:hypothetical protein
LAMLGDERSITTFSFLAGGGSMPR